MFRKSSLRLKTTAVLAALVSSLVGSSVTTAGQSRTDLASIACNFFFRLKGATGSPPSVNSLDSSTDCDGYHIYLSNHPTDRSQSTVRISEMGTAGSMTYHLADMPLDVVVLLVMPSRQPTRMLVRRRSDRIDFIVGRTSFEQPPPTALLPRSSSRVERAPVPRGSSPAAASWAQTTALIGTWRTVGAVLELREDGTFSKVSNSSFGSFGGVIGLDDNGTFEVHANQIVFHGMLRERTCAYSLTSRDDLVLCDSKYRRE